MIDAASAVLSNPMLTQPFTIRRPTPAMQEGVAVSTSAETTARGSVQPPRTSELQGLPEGQRLLEHVSVWSKTEIKADPGAPDELVVDGKLYRVVGLETWPDHYRALAQRVLP